MSNLHPSSASASHQHGLNGEPSGSINFDLTIRFSASLPDLLLSIPVGNPNDNDYSPPNTATLKQRIRAAIPPEYSNRRIRLIYAGKALEDVTPLEKSLKRPVSRPPSRVATPGPYDDGGSTGLAGNGKAFGQDKGKGKTPIRDPPAAQPRIYIHCSIGDIVLSKEELDAEAATAYPVKGSSSSRTESQNAGQNKQEDENTATTAPTPRGFDRLLSAGFSPAEVHSLRLQFLAIQAHTHTPDTMPSPNTLRNMEDRWLDNSNASDGSAIGGQEGGGLGATGADDGQAGALDDMIWGTAMGFFWPVGCLMWGTREEGVFSPRRKIAIVIGVMLNVGLGFVRYGG